MSHNTAAVRQLLKVAFDDEAFAITCFDHFPDVYAQFTAGMGRLVKTRLLLECCEKNDEFDKLLNLIRQKNPNQFNKFAPMLISSSPRKVSQIPKADVDSSRSRVEITLPGDLSEVSPEKLELAFEATVGALAGALGIPRDQIDVLYVLFGSIILGLRMPTEAGERLIALYETSDPLIQSLGIQQVPQFVWEIPVVSHIAAGLGHPIAQENIKGYEELRESKPEGGENYFILVVDGDSMAGDGIASGDKVLIRQQEGAKNRDITAVVINTPNTEPIGVLKRYYVVSQEDEAMRHWLLESSNPSSEHLVVMPEGVDVKAIRARYGKVLGHKFEFYGNAELSIAGVFVKVVEKA